MSPSVAIPWALWPHSPILALAAVVLLIGLSTIFGTPGGKPGRVIVPVPGIVTVLLVLLQLVAATVAAWFAWPWWVAAPATVLCLIVPVTELPRWRRLLGMVRMDVMLPRSVRRREVCSLGLGVSRSR